MAAAIFSLHATHRWAVTGTPIQNRFADLGSLFRFLRIYPFDDPQYFKIHVSRSLKIKNDRESISRLRLLVRAVTIRRSKKAIDLPFRKDEIHYLRFTTLERNVYENVKQLTIRQLDAASSISGPYRVLNVLQWLTALRLVCNLGLQCQFVPKANLDKDFGWNKHLAQSAFEELANGGQACCSECFQDLSLRDIDGRETHDVLEEEPCLSETLQLFCPSCVPDLGYKHRLIAVCNHLPRCRDARLSEAASPGFEGHAMDPEPENGQIPTKIKALLTDLSKRPSNAKR